MFGVNSKDLPFVIGLNAKCLSENLSVIIVFLSEKGILINIFLSYIFSYLV